MMRLGVRRVASSVLAMRYGASASMPLARRFATSDSSSSDNTAVQKQQTVPQFDVQTATNNTQATVGPFLTGTPVEQLKERRVRITVPTRNVMQSGEAKMNRWVITWDTKERWQNPLMGWASTADPLSNVDVKFDSKEDAIAFCERNGWTYYVHEPSRRRRMKKNYGNNFSWDKRTRKNTK
ncbi:NADH dehydrogenase iron-sulfur protein 4 [Salpingoeca rosetta]|uniref:NADH dehydrogenase [ubiquinone] iron-sulfur protein 4, mitochondrial n=1 Tax=Salpingoeca rosetta (strain ATCC 50818 / BSB-021) TaxID=946362 RepID=F2TVX8_SALR5|nr:NADH dehydrogenase iron-sulfur protein 4 [Salpingoeca rosetta]EGD72224.1 NADH dehydrogenase iron-sulfur protein 4 [Salpingoeca rosetta]|eukprot:XP_004998795.1 NADH dehydrogenase iron-sulfur protein 4 [Salpingoeca rosetta]